MFKKNYKLFFVLLLINSYCKSEWAEKILSELTIEQKIAQLFIIGIDNEDYLVETKSIDDTQNQVINVEKKNFNKKKAEKFIKEYNVGGIHFVRYGTLESCFNAINYFQSISDIPLLVSQDFEWGLSMRLTDAIRFPRNMTLGAIENNDLIYELGKEIGRQCKLLGVHINYAPVVDININPANPIIGDRSFGQDKQNVSIKSIYFAKGLQDAGIIACAKHFCGHGDTDVDSHLDLPIIQHDIARLNDIEFYPFAKIIDSGVKSIMSAHIHVPAVDATPNIPITLSYNAMTDILQNQLGFKGLIITDALNMKGVTNNFAPGEIELKAFLAGNDILLMSKDVPRAIRKIKRAILDDKISIKELDRRVLKVLKAKEDLNLHVKRAERKFSVDDFNTKNAYRLKKLLYESAVTFVKNSRLLYSKSFFANQKTALIIIGQKPENYKTFHDAMSQYKSNIFCFYIDKNDQKNKFDKLFEAVQDFEIILVGLFDLVKSAQVDYGVTSNTLEFLETVNKDKKMLLTIFGNPYSLKFFNNFKNIIMAYENDIDAQQAAAKVIYGKLEPNEKLPINI